MKAKYPHRKRSQSMDHILGKACVLWMTTAGLASADPVGLVTLDKTSPAAAAQGLRTWNLYVQFDSPNDVLLSIGFADISTDAPLGFYQNPFGSDLAPNTALCSFPPLDLLCSDSFVTVGKKDSVGDTTSTDPSFNCCSFNCVSPGAQACLFSACPALEPGEQLCGGLYGGWANITFDGEPCPGCPEDINGDGWLNPIDSAMLLGNWGTCPPPPTTCVADLSGDGEVDAADLAHLLDAGGPGNANGVPDADLRVLIAQLTFSYGLNASGTLTVFHSGGPPEGISYFFTLYCGCFSGEDCNDGNPCTDDVCTQCICSHPNLNSVPCYDGETCTVNDECLAGACAGTTTDLTGNGAVGPEDLAILLGAWGANPGHPADANSDGSVDAADLALLLGSWGSCT